MSGSMLITILLLIIESTLIIMNPLGDTEVNDVARVEESDGKNIGVTLRNNLKTASSGNKICCEKKQRLSIKDRMEIDGNTQILKQSPVNINTCTTDYDKHLKGKFLKIDYKPINLAYKNNGHTIKWELQTSNVNQEVPLITVDGQSYTFSQMHLHWGSVNDIGSEHYINGESYAAEMHLVHSKVENSPNDNKKDETLAVIGLSIEARKTCPSGVSFLNDHLYAHVVESVTIDKQSISDVINLIHIFPSLNEDEYYTYKGSLTTPPFSETVRWIVMKKPICATFDFLKALRNLKGNAKEFSSGVIRDNFRSIMPLNERKISRSFEDF